jgi:ribosomal protein S18 acetylase RimI-like enzyme
MTTAGEVTALAPSTPDQALAALVLRPAREEDALCLAVLAMQVFLDTYATHGIRQALAREVLATYSEEAFRRHLEEPQTHIVVAEAMDHLVGFAQVTEGVSHPLAPAGNAAELLRLYVQEPFTARGVGTRLLHEAEAAAGARGASTFWLTPWVHNHRALAFYRRRGYTDHRRTLFTFEGESHENRVFAKRLVPADA